MKAQPWKKAAAALLCALLLWTSEAQAAQQIGKAVSGRPGETILAISAHGMGSLGSPKVAPAAISLSASPVDNPANLAPAPALPSAIATPAQPQPLEPSLPMPSGLGQPGPIEGHAVVIAQSAVASRRPGRRRLQFRLSSLLKMTMVAAMPLGLYKNYDLDAANARKVYSTHLQPISQAAYLARLKDIQNADVKLGVKFGLFVYGLGELHRELHGKMEPLAFWDPLCDTHFYDHDLSRSYIGANPNPWSETALRNLYQKYLSNRNSHFMRRTEEIPRDTPLSYEEFQSIADAQLFFLKVRNNPQLWEDPFAIYQDFLNSVVAKHSRLKPLDLERFNQKTKYIHEAANFPHTAKVYTKYGLLGGLAAAATVLLYGFAWLKHKAKSALSWIKQAASKSNGTPLLGAALFALPGPSALLGAINGWAAAGIALAAATLTALSYLVRRHRVKPQFSLSGLLKMVGVIAMILGLLRAYRIDTVELDHLETIKSDILETSARFAPHLWNQKIDSPQGDFSLFLAYVDDIQVDIYDTNEGRPFDLLFYSANRADTSVAHDLIGAGQTPWTDSELKDLYQRYLKQLYERKQREKPEDYTEPDGKFHTRILEGIHGPIDKTGEFEPISFEKFQLIADVHALYLKARENPDLQGKPDIIYQEFLHLVAKHAHAFDTDLKQMEQRARYALEGFNSNRAIKVYSKDAGLALLAALISAYFLWPKRKP